MTAPGRMVCPHDGVTCHHACAAKPECLRWRTGASFTAPFPGYPLPGYESGPPADEAEAERTAALARLRAGK